MIYSVKHLYVTAPRLYDGAMWRAVDCLDLRHPGTGVAYRWSPAEFVALTMLGGAPMLLQSTKLRIAQTMLCAPATYAIVRGLNVCTTNTFAEIEELLLANLPGVTTVINMPLIPVSAHGQDLIRNALREVTVTT